MVKISIIMAVYNQEQYLRHAIDSILNQSFRDFEFIIVNDASTDKTLDILESYALADPRIKLYSNKKNLGLTKSLNKALKKAKGKYVAEMDSDDVSMPDRLKIQYAFLQKHPEIFLVGGAVTFIDIKDKILRDDYPIQDSEEIAKILRRKNCLWHPTIMFRRDNIKYRDKFLYAQDYDLYTRIITSNRRIINIPEVLCKYRLHSQSTSYAKKAKQHLFVRKIAEFYNQRLQQGYDDYAKFDPKIITNIDTGNLADKELLLMQEKAAWDSDQIAKSRKLALKYFKHHGLNFQLLIHYIVGVTKLITPYRILHKIFKNIAKKTAKK